ncbi:MAG: bacillithiol system redox-active protein YtxJ [Chitinophagaceae bacterium]|jgi:bacillithiol system protein YtxJ|nr:bacillithiol system redox-active protein YtxJ [Chitinophagaceae bacterium]
MNFSWKQLHQSEEIDDIIRMSCLRPQVIFKHSHRCNISSVAKRRLENHGPAEGIDFYILDVISNRDLSNRVGQIFEVWHESPQVLLIIDGECIYDESHMGISMNDLLEQAEPKIKG